MTSGGTSRDREARLAEALRANLRKRKAQKQAQQKTHGKACDAEEPETKAECPQGPDKDGADKSD
ncbi:MAG: hypothetical protein AB8B85_15495 [Paracoccaceae bacterium]